MTNKTTYLKDYKAPAYQIQNVDLVFELEPKKTIVKSHLKIKAKSDITTDEALVLQGENMKLLSIHLNDEVLPMDAYDVTAETLTLYNPPTNFTLDIITQINPDANTAFSGLYISNDVFCTQCEAEGFRRITYFIDRPDNLSYFSTTIIADKEKYPVMLSNGNCIAEGEMGDGRAWVKWEDPFLKPSYLFALVAGKLDLLEDKFVTKSGREVKLQLYVDVGELDKTTHAMECLKKSMRWDEDVYRREYDLDIFMTVAVRDFNMGAMENKGLNVFNSKYILANPKTATDFDYENILRVVGHEYFHNWSGNRVTCRDWFQLSLKEGLTVFRDQNFTADHVSTAIKRIDDVNVLRTYQFPEDSGPMAHPVQPKSYMEIDNFYTQTIYNKGAEVIRMQHTLLGEEKFHQGMDLYFQCHDGEAVRIEEFVHAMEDASGLNLTQFKNWYHQAGTPELTIKDKYDAKQKQYTLIVSQQTPKTPGQKEKQPFHIPLAIGLLDQQGNEILSTQVLQLTTPTQEFLFNDVKERPVVSLLRGFSAPVNYTFPYTSQDLALLFAHDSDSFSRWQAGQHLALQQLNQLMTAYQAGQSLQVDDEYIAALHQVMMSEFNEPALQALLLTLPSEKYMFELQESVNPDAIHVAREFLRKTIATKLTAALDMLYQKNVATESYHNNPVENAKRRIKNVCLSYLSLFDSGKQAWQQYQLADNMTDSIAALVELVNVNNSNREEALQNFYKQWQHDALVMDKWLTVQAMSNLPNTLDTVKKLTRNKIFNKKNPNSIRALIGAFVGQNLVQFHTADGSGYEFLATQIVEIDRLNAQVAATLVVPLLHWRRFSKDRQQLMQQQLEKILKTKDLSKNTYEIVSKALSI